MSVFTWLLCSLCSRSSMIPPSPLQALSKGDKVMVRTGLEVEGAVEFFVQAVADPSKCGWVLKSVFEEIDMFGGGDDY